MGESLPMDACECVAVSLNKESEYLTLSFPLGAVNEAFCAAHW